VDLATKHQLRGHGEPGTWATLAKLDSSEVRRDDSDRQRTELMQPMKRRRFRSSNEVQ